MDGTNRQMKHETMDSAIVMLNSAVNELQATLAQIKGEEELPKQPGTPSASFAPSLGEFLSTGMERIITIRDRIAGITKEIKDILF